MDLGRSKRSCDALGRCTTSGTGSGSAGRGTSRLTGVLSTELGVSGLAMVNFPIASGGSNDIIDLWSSDWRGGAVSGAEPTEDSVVSVGTGIRLMGSVFRCSIDGLSKDCRWMTAERLTLRSE